MSLPIGRRVAVDLGPTRSGLAISDREGILAVPVGSFPDEILLQTLSEMALDDVIVQIYIGLPRHLSGSEGVSANMARAKAETIAKARIAPVRLVDERLTTKSAARDIEEVRRFGIDAVAAREILEFALQGERSSGEFFGEEIDV